MEGMEDGTFVDWGLPSVVPVGMMVGGLGGGGVNLDVCTFEQTWQHGWQV